MNPVVVVVALIAAAAVGIATFDPRIDFTYAYTSLGKMVLGTYEKGETSEYF